ncbi:unnamed protein product [Meganyctiphanes norvegica]|uniref:F5/8 type C domain-containing protein n=1 Tax=Meganyctiphanes norvegica TaxID=48144 RepID=A0AAV2RTA5_MEGNR
MGTHFFLFVIFAVVLTEVELAKITTPETTLDSPVPHHQPDKELEAPSPNITIANIISTSLYTEYHGPDNTIDGDTFSSWNPLGEEYFITFELSERYTVSGINLLNQGDYTHDVTKFKLEASNNLDSWYLGGSVDDVQAGTHEWQSFDGFTASGKYLRIIFTETYSGYKPWLSELSFSGHTGKYVFLCYCVMKFSIKTHIFTKSSIYI